MRAGRRVHYLFMAAAAASLCVCVCVAAASAATIFALTSHGELYASSDLGVNWGIRAEIPVSDAVTIMAGGDDSVLYLASRSGRLFQSMDGGAAWTEEAGVQSPDLCDLVAAPDGRILCLAASGTLWERSPAQTSFHVLAELGYPDCAGLEMLPDGSVFALTRSGVLLRSESGGIDWTVRTTFPVPDAVDIAHRGLDVYALAGAGEVLLYAWPGTLTSGLVIGTLSQSGSTGLASISGTLVAVTRSGLVATSPDGVAWSWSGTVNQVWVTAIGSDIPLSAEVQDPGSPASAFCAAWPNPARRGGELRIRFGGCGASGLNVYDCAGRLVHSEGTPETAGSAARVWNIPCERLKSGVYFARPQGDAPAHDGATGNVRNAIRFVVLD
jgi:hypothetical protein